jgi:hypothetical protein
MGAEQLHPFVRRDYCPVSVAAEGLAMACLSGFFGV